MNLEETTELREVFTLNDEVYSFKLFHIALSVFTTHLFEDVYKVESAANFCK